MVDQTSQFYAILTNVGAAKQANADALGIAWKITEMAVGDGNPGNVENPALPQPSANWTALLNEWRRAPLNQLKVDDKDSSIIVAEQIIPADIGGRWIREIGLYDADGDLVAVANCAPTYKPLLNQGSGRTQVVRMNLIVSSASNVQLKIDPSVVLATREWVTTGLAGKVNVADKATKAIAEAGVDDSKWMTSFSVLQSVMKQLDKVGLADSSPPVLANFEAVVPSGIYMGYSSGHPTAPTPGGPPSEGNNLISILAMSPRSDATHYFAMENGGTSARRRMWYGQYNAQAPAASMFWSSVLTSDQVATQAEVDAGAADDVVVTPKKMRFGFAANIALNGYIVFPSWLGGLVIQWGGFSHGEATNYVAMSVPFNIAFPSACYNVQCISDAGVTTSDLNGFTRVNVSVTLASRDPTGLVVAGTLYWIAFGK